MPGANCTFPGCHVTRTKKHKRISIFQIPTRNGESYSGWRKSILNVLTKYRSFTNKLISMKEYLKEIFTSVNDMLKIILNSQVSKKNNLHYSNELGQKLRE